MNAVGRKMYTLQTELDKRNKKYKIQSFNHMRKFNEKKIKILKIR